MPREYVFAVAVVQLALRSGIQFLGEHRRYHRLKIYQIKRLVVPEDRV